MCSTRWSASSRTSGPRSSAIAFDVHSLASAIVISAVLLPLSYLYFKRVEATVADVI